MNCRIFDTDNQEIINFNIDHFDEHMYEDKFSLTCMISLNEDMVTDAFLERFKCLFNKTFSLIQISDEDRIIAQYTKYTTAPEGIMVNGHHDYLEGVITFYQTKNVD